MAYFSRSRDFFSRKVELILLLPDIRRSKEYLKQFASARNGVSSPFKSVLRVPNLMDSANDLAKHVSCTVAETHRFPKHGAILETILT